MIPINREFDPKLKKFFTISKGVDESIFELTAVYFITVLNSMIETASFITPSPNTMLNSFGYSS